LHHLLRSALGRQTLEPKALDLHSTSGELQRAGAFKCGKEPGEFSASLEAKPSPDESCHIAKRNPRFNRGVFNSVSTAKESGR